MDVEEKIELLNNLTRSRFEAHESHFELLEERIEKLERALGVW